MIYNLTINYRNKSFYTLQLNTAINPEDGSDMGQVKRKIKEIVKEGYWAKVDSTMGFYIPPSSITHIYYQELLPTS